MSDLDKIRDYIENSYGDETYRGEVLVLVAPDSRIALACNAHDALVAALEIIMEGATVGGPVHRIAKAALSTAKEAPCAK